MSSHKIIKSNQLLSDHFKFSSETELNSLSQFLISQTEGKIFHDTKGIFDSTYALNKTLNHQFRHLMVYLKLQIMQRIITVRVNRYMILFNYH